MSRNNSRSSTYRKISYQDRLKLIEEVCEKKRSIVSAAKEIEIHPSTARMIIFKYKIEGRVFETKLDKVRRLSA